MRLPSSWWTCLTAALLAPAAARAQIDYRNLDDDRPTRVEDAYPIERYAFELLFPYAVHAEKGGGAVHAVVPELAYGLLPNTHVGVKAPLALAAAGGETDVGLAGLQAFALYHLALERGVLPAVALRVDGYFPVGSLSGSETWATLKGILTKSWGTTRAHANAAVRVGRDGTPAALESPGRWWAGLALDRTFYRQSLLLVAESWVERPASGAPLEVAATLGARWQWTPTTVLDLGIGRGLRAGLGPEVAFSVGLSHAFAARALMPRGR